MRLPVANSLHTRPGDHTKGARMLNAYPETKGDQVFMRKRASAKRTGIVVGANAQMIGNLLEAHVGIGAVGGGNTVTINETSTTSANTFTSATKTTAANCLSVTPNVSFLSVRGNGSGLNLYRSVKWRVEYWNGSSWVAGSYRILDMGAQTTTAQTDSTTYTFPSAGTWQWRVYAESYDTSGATFGTTTYTYSTETLNASTLNDSVTDDGSDMVTSTKTVTYTLPSSTVNTSWEIYQIRYQANYTAAFKMYSFDGFGYPLGTFSTALKKAGTTSVTHYVDGVSHYGSPFQTDYSYSGSLDSGTISGSSLSYSASYFSAFLSNYEYSGGTPANPQVSISFSSGTVTIYRRTPTTNSATPSNTYTVTSYNEALQADLSVQITDATMVLATVVNDELNLITMNLCSGSWDSFDMTWDDCVFGWDEAK